VHHWVGQFFVFLFFLCFKLCFPFVLSLFVIRGGYIYIHLFQVIPTTRKYGPNNSFNISLIFIMIFMNIQSNEVVMENLNKQVNNYLTTRVFFFPVFSCCTQGGDKPYEDLAKYGYKKILKSNFVF
jgi:hypothetical protein